MDWGCRRFGRIAFTAGAEPVSAKLMTDEV
jgi:hypothetical protein